jgi:hypothetical protein
MRRWTTTAAWLLVDGGHIAVDILVQARCMRVEEEESGSYRDGD